MTMWRSPRKVQTTIPCKDCGVPLMAERSCHKVFLTCAACRKTVDVAAYADSFDETLEDFMGSVPCDRT